MKLITNDFRSILTGNHGTPCLSLYQHTHRHHPSNQEDPIRFRNLIKQLDLSLRQQYSTQEITALLEPFEALARDHGFWKNTVDGLAVFGTPGFFQVFGMQRMTREIAVVAESFHIKPMVSFLQSADRFQVLALNLHEIKRFEGSGVFFDEVNGMWGKPLQADAKLAV